MKKQPKIIVEKQLIDYILSSLALFCLCFMMCVTVIYYNKLPDQIPIHFDANGDPDGFAGKNMIFGLPILSLILISGLHFLSKVPHTYNYIIEITKENAHLQYQQASRMMRAMNAIIAAMFSYILWASIQVALGNWTGLGSGFLVISMLTLFGTIFYFVMKSKKLF